VGSIGSFFGYLACSGGVSTLARLYLTMFVATRLPLTEFIYRRFPVITGFRVSWDSRRPPGQRVLGVWLWEDQADDVSVVSNDSDFSTPTLKDGEAISCNDTKPKYKILTREYMAQGHDGFTSLCGNKYLIDDESGQITSAVVRKYLLGPSAINSAYKPRVLTNCHRFTIR
jgi:hypothetical protein